NLAGILGTLTVQGGSGTANRLIVSDYGSANSDAGVVVTNNSITAFAPASIFYSAAGKFTDGTINDGILLRGSNKGGNTFNVQSTLGGSTTEIDGDGGLSDTFNVSSDAGTNNGNLAGILGTLTVQGGSGTANRLIVSDYGSANSDAGVVVTNNRITAFAPASIFYSAAGKFTDGTINDGILLRGSNTGGNTFNVQSTLGGSTTQIDGDGGLSDTFNVSSDAGTNNGNLAGILGTLTVQGGSGTANRLIVSDYGDTTAGRDTFIQVYNNLLHGFAPGDVYYSAAGGGQFNNASSSGILLKSSYTLPSTFVVYSTLGVPNLNYVSPAPATTTYEIDGGQNNDTFNIGDTHAGNSGNLDLIQGLVTVVGNGGSDSLVVNDEANKKTSNGAHAFNYLVTPTQIINDPTPVKTVPAATIPPTRTFATGGVIYNASATATRNSVTTLRVDGTDDVNIFSVTPSTLTTYTINGNLPASGVPLAGGGDYLKLDTSHFSDQMGGRTLHITSVGNGNWTFDPLTNTHPVYFESIERFNHVAITAKVETLPNQSPAVVVRDAETGQIKFQFTPYSDITGGASVAVGDVNNDGLPDVIVAPGRNQPAIITIYSGTPDASGNYAHMPLVSFPAFTMSFRTGISLAVGDINGDGANDLVVGSGASIGNGFQPYVEVFDGRTLLQGTAGAAPTQLPGSPFLALEPSFTGGVNVAVGDLNNDGKADIVATRMSGKATVSVFTYTGSGFGLARTFIAYTTALNGGLTAAVGDFNADGWNDIILGSGPGASPAVMVYAGGPTLSSSTTTPPPLLALFHPSPATFTGGVAVTTTPVNGGDPGTIERVFVTANLVGTASFFWYSLLGTDLLPTPNQLFVSAAYRDILGRLADLPGLTSRRNELDQGSLSRSQFASDLTHSFEYFSDIVTTAYQRYLGRTPAYAEMSGWVIGMEGGLSDEHLEAMFIGSAEYIQDHGGRADQMRGWIKGMYQDLLGRTPAQAEIEGWVTAMTNGMSPTDVAFGFAASVERETQRVTADYLRYLERQPSASEVNGWVQYFEMSARNEDVIAGFVGSDEYFQRNTR
ncbi:MAG TPA: DUF4214 domain-containing protein, partial [Gemmataceae bacterium]|nr:DUF4214 domain-containing protein [Gemmataceae bacterium]